MYKTIKSVLTKVMVLMLCVSIMCHLEVTVLADISALNGVETFEYDSTTAVGTTRNYSTENISEGTGDVVSSSLVSYETVKTEYGKSAVFKYAADKSPTFCPNFTLSDNGVYHISFNLYPYTTDAKRIFKLRQGDTNNNYYPIFAFDNDGNVVFYEHETSLQAAESSDIKTVLGSYTAQNWYNVDIYVDTTNDKYSIKVDRQDGLNVITVGKKTDVKLTGWGNGIKRFKICQYMPTAATAGDNLMALDNVKLESYTSVATAVDFYTNIANGATNVDIDKNLKIYSSTNTEISEIEAKLMKDSAEVIGAFAAPVISGTTAELNLAANLLANTTYSLELKVKYDTFPDSASKTKIIGFTTGDGTDRKTVIDLKFDDLSDTSAIPSGVITGDDVAGSFSLYNANGGKVLKVKPDTTDKNSYLNFSVPTVITDTVVVVEYDMCESQLEYIKSSATLVNGTTTTFLQEYNGNNTNIFNGADASVSNSVSREAAQAYNHYKFFINVDSTGVATNYYYYVNGVSKTGDTPITFTSNIPVGFKTFTLKMFPNAGLTADDYILFDNIKVSYIDKSVDNVISYINNATTAAEIKAVLSGPLTSGADYTGTLREMGIDLDLYNNNLAVADAVATMIFNQANIADFDRTNIKDYVNKVLNTQALANATTSDQVKAIFENAAVMALFDITNLGDKFDTAYSTMTANEKTRLYTHIANKTAFSSFDALTTAYQDGIILALINEATYDKMEGIISNYKADRDIVASTDYASYIAMQPYYKSEVDKKLVLAKVFDDFDDIKSAFENAVEDVLIVIAQQNQQVSNPPSSRPSSTSSFTYKPTETVTPPATEVEDNDKPEFNDLDDVEWAIEAINYLVEMGVISGYGDGSFLPNQKVTREEFIKMIVEAFEFLNENAECKFSDVNIDSWSYKYIASAFVNGIISGYADGRFGADDSITREDMAVILNNVLNKLGKATSTPSNGINNFDDKDKVSDYAVEAVGKLNTLGILNGVGNNMLDPSGITTRAQAAKVIYELLQLISSL